MANTTSYGSVFTTDVLKQQLKEANRTYDGRKTFEQLYGNIALAEQKALSSLQQDYSSAVSEAYLSSLGQEQNILSSNLGQGFKERELEENQLALQEAFNAYQQNYIADMQSIQETTAEATGIVTSRLESQADYAKQFYESAYEYLQYLSKNHSDSKLWENEYYSRFLNKDSSLQSWNDIVLNQKLFEGDVFSPEATITNYGTDFYKQILLDQTLQTDVPTYWNWLGTEKSDLFNWVTSTTPYSTEKVGNVVYSPTNKDVLQKLLGISPDDLFTTDTILPNAKNPGKDFKSEVRKRRPTHGVSFNTTDKSDDFFTKYRKAKTSLRPNSKFLI